MGRPHRICWPAPRQDAVCRALHVRRECTSRTRCLPLPQDLQPRIFPTSRTVSETEGTMDGGCDRYTFFVPAIRCQLGRGGLRVARLVPGDMHGPPGQHSHGSRWAIDTSRPGALCAPGSMWVRLYRGRHISLPTFRRFRKSRGVVFVPTLVLDERDVVEFQLPPEHAPYAFPLMPQRAVRRRHPRGASRSRFTVP